MHFNIGTNPNVVFEQLYNNVSDSLQKQMIVKFWVVFGSCYQWARKPQNNPITASYIGGLTPL